MTDPHLPTLHRVHPRGWINDPNGIHRTADGRWHVFFQYNPASARHELIQNFTANICCHRNLYPLF